MAKGTKKRVVKRKGVKKACKPCRPRRARRSRRSRCCRPRGGNFLNSLGHTLGSIGKAVLPFAPLLL